MANGPETEGSAKTGAEASRERRIADAAARALAEAAERRASAAEAATEPEFGGRAGPEPTRFGDWEKKGLAIDF